MEVVFPCCAGLDLHKQNVVACRIIPGPTGQPQKEIRTFPTMTRDLLALSDWLLAGGVTHVAMESTGVYWKPVFNLLEDNFTLLLVNAAHIKQVPGRKSDVKDCEWIADLLRHGLLRGSFVPERFQREVRELTRYRTSLVRERSAEQNRLQKTLEGANIKLSCVASDLLGVSARQMLAGLCAGQSDAAALAQLAKGRLREKTEALEQALEGQFGAHQQFLVARQLAHIDYLEELIEQVSAQITAQLGDGAPPPAVPPPGDSAAPAEEQSPLLAASLPLSPLTWEEGITLAMSIHGVGQRIAEVVLAEIGLGMSRFATAGHLASWAGLVPGLNISAGKRLGNKTRRGSPWLRSALVEAAHAASRTKGTYLSALYRRVAARRGKKKAVIALARTILTIIYHLLKHRTPYEELGEQYFDEREREAVERRAVRRLEGLGWHVVLEAKQAA